MTVTESLKRFRKEKKITQKDIAECLGITQQTYQYYESNGGLSADFIKKIAEHYEVSTDYLLGVSDETNDGHFSVNGDDLKEIVASFNQSAQALKKALDKQNESVKQQ